MLGPLKLLEITDLATDFISGISIKDQVDSRFRRLIFTSLIASSVLNVFGIWWAHRLRKNRSFYLELINLSLGLLLLGFEDGIMVPINCLFFLNRIDVEFNETANETDGFALDAEFTFELASVGVSLMVGVLSVVVRVWTVLRFVLCADPRYIGSVKVVKEFLRMEKGAGGWQRPPVQRV